MKSMTPIRRAASERIHYSNPSAGTNVPEDWCHKCECLGVRVKWVYTVSPKP